jgi:very-short-patch-repair endonuclease
MTTEARSFARALRRSQTSAEEMLWPQLRGRRLSGAKWRRQVPFGRYTADFVCIVGRLIVEIDGRQHALQADYDVERTGVIEAMGFVVLRFTNGGIRNSLDELLLRIKAELERQ